MEGSTQPERELVETYLYLKLLKEKKKTHNKKRPVSKDNYNSDKVDELINKYKIGY